MLSFLFPRLTPAEASRGSALFAALVREARQTHWYVEGQIPDTLDGRFTVLATMAALATAGGIAGAAGAVLTPLEVEEFFGILRRMREQGKTVIIITHKLSEVLAISDEVTVMRDGKVVGRVQTKDTNAAELAQRAERNARRRAIRCRDE